MSIADGTDHDFQKSLMENGVFPENTPPLFRVRNFYDVCNRQGMLSAEQIKKNKPTRLSTYNETKRGGQRRIFSTPNPLFFIDAAIYFAKHRKKLVNHLQRSNFSKSIPIFDNSTDRFVRIESHSEFTRFRRTALSTSRYIVKTDIARFFLQYILILLLGLFTVRHHPRETEALDHLNFLRTNWTILFVRHRTNKPSAFQLGPTLLE